MPMRYYYLFYLSCLFGILMYILGGQDQMSDVVSLCQSKYGFTADNKQFVCIPSVEYFGENK